MECALFRPNVNKPSLCFFVEFSFDINNIFSFVVNHSFVHQLNDFPQFIVKYEFIRRDDKNRAIIFHHFQAPLVDE